MVQYDCQGEILGVISVRPSTHLREERVSLERIPMNRKGYRVEGGFSIFLLRFCSYFDLIVYTFMIRN